MTEKIKVLVVDDHEVFCESLAALLSMRGDIEVVGTANCGRDAIRKTELLGPKIVLLDVKMKDLDGIQCMREIKERSPGTEFIMLTMYTDEEHVLEAIKAGAKGYVLKESSSSEVLEAIKAVSQGRAFFDSNSSSELVKGIRHQNKSTREALAGEDPLSQREVEVLRLIGEGYSNKEISKKLFISSHTTRNHVANIFIKLNCHNRTKAIIQGRKKGLI